MQPLQFAVEAGDAGWYLEVTAWLVALTVTIGIVALWMYLRYTGIGAEERRQLSAIIPELFRASSVTITLKRSEGATARRPDLRRVLTRDLDSAEDAGEETLRGSFKEFHRDLKAVLPDAPRLAGWGVVEGLLILTFGSVLFLSAAWWERALDWPGATTAVTDTLAVILELAFSGLAAFPVADELLVVALTLGVMLWDVMVHYCWLVGISLIALGVAFAYIDHETDETLDVTLYPQRKWFYGALAATPLAIWLLGVTTAATTGLIAGPGWATPIGFLTAGAATLAAAGYAAWDLRGRVVSQQDRPERDTRLVAGYILVRRSLLVTAVAALPLLAYTSLASLTTGHAGTVLVTLLAAPLTTQIALLVGVGGVTALVVYEMGAIATFAGAIRRLGRSTALRGWLFARGIPYTAMLLAFLLTWAFIGTHPIGDITLISALLSVWPPLLAAIIVGVIVRIWTLLWTRVRYRFMDFWYRREKTDPYVSVACYPQLEDADGRPLYHARIYGVDLGHRNLNQLLEDIETVADAYFDGDDPPATMSQYYWDDVLRGTVDLDATTRELRGDVLTRIRASFRANGGELSDTAVDEELIQEYPRNAIDGALRMLYEDGEISYGDGRYIHHGHTTRKQPSLRAYLWQRVTRIVPLE
jgi:hypothetical protein